MGEKKWRPGQGRRYVPKVDCCKQNHMQEVTASMEKTRWAEGALEYVPRGDGSHSLVSLLTWETYHRTSKMAMVRYSSIDTELKKGKHVRTDTPKKKN